MINDLLDKIVRFQKQYPNIYVGGSIALMLQEAIPYRIPKDIDLITPQKIHIYDLFTETQDRPNKHPMSRIVNIYGTKWELFHNPDAQFVEHYYKGNHIKISPIQEIYDWKIKFSKKYPEDEKHIKDIKYYNGI
jgi:hypothetical protein